MIQSGTSINKRYRLQEPLGKGGMAKVWLAQDEKLNRPVAIKLLHPHHANNEELLERFAREARALGQLNSPFIVQVHDVGKDNEGRTFIVMEFVDGRTLKSRLDAPLSVQQALTLLGA